MKKSKLQIRLKPERLPRALAAAVLASSLCAFVLTGIPGVNMAGAQIHFAMLLCAAFTAVLELSAIQNSFLLIGCATFACAGGVLFFAPFGGESIYAAITEGAEISVARVLTVILLLCGALCLAVCALNRSFIARCIAAAGLLILLILFIWLRSGLLTVPAILFTAYILIVLCQICALGKSHVSDTPRDMWFVLFSLITAVIVFSLPYPETRIRWEKLFEIRPTEQLEQLGETLDIEPINDDTQKSDSGYSEDQSSLGGWLEMVSDVQLRVVFSDNDHSDRLTGAIYDCYTGTGWICRTEAEGTGYAAADGVSPSDALPVSGSDLYGRVHISEIGKASEGGEKQTSLFYPPYSRGIFSAGSGEAAVRDGMRLIFEQSRSNSYEAYYYKQLCGYELTASEWESLLTLPEELPGRVRELAMAAVEGCADDESKACELMRVLSGCSYEIRVESPPDGRDFVDYFLFESREGYCAYFASAMAVMARCAGIPSRYVQGYYIGSADGLSVTVSSSNAHAWAELYIDGSWIIYDPAVSPMENTASDTSADHQDNEPERNSSEINRILIYSYAVIAAAAAVFIAFRPFLRRIPWRVYLRRKYGKNSSYPVIVCCGKLMWVLSACGVRRDDSETLTEFGTRIRRECEWLNDVTGERITCILNRTDEALYSSDSRVELPEKNAARAVRKAYIRRFGLVKYLRGYRRATLRI